MGSSARPPQKEVAPEDVDTGLALPVKGSRKKLSAGLFSWGFVLATHSVAAKRACNT